MKRREFITLLGGAAAAWPLAARGQQPDRVRRIGFLGLAPISGFASRIEAFRAGLRNLGYVEGSNIVIEFRWAERPDELPKLAAELVDMNVDVIFASSSIQVKAAREATKTIPIVFGTHADPVGLGHVASLARPGANITGLSMMLTELTAKQLEILKEAIPHATRVGVLWVPATPSHALALDALEAAGKKLGVELQMVPVRTVEEFDPAFAIMTGERVDCFLVVPSVLAYDEVGGAQCFDRDPCLGIFGQERIHDRIGNPIANLVRMPLRYRLTGKDEVFFPSALHGLPQAIDWKI